MHTFAYEHDGLCRNCKYRSSKCFGYSCTQLIFLAYLLQRETQFATTTSTNKVLSCFVWIVFIVLAVVMALRQGVMNVQWVITACLGPGPNTSTRVHLDPSTPALRWQHLRTACPALQVTRHLLLMNLGFGKSK